MKTFKIGGIHPSPSKLTSDKPTSALAAPAEVTLLMSQSIGAPAKPTVKKGDIVKAGDLVGEAGGFVSANVHTPFGGTVKSVGQVRDMRGRWAEGVVIQVDPEAGVPEAKNADADSLKPGEIISAVADAGIVGLGGATFPTRVKLSIPEGKSVDTVIINGAECEPYLTCDDRLMREHPEKVVAGARLIARAVGDSRVVVGIEANKPEAIDAIRSAGGEVVVLQTKYPQGGEKQLIEAVTGRRVPSGGLPVDVHCVVDNVATAAAVADAVENTLPLTGRIVTVTGPSVANPGNFYVPLGTPITSLIEAAGGIPDDTESIIAGGPMMGGAISCLEAPTTKGLSGLLFLPASLARKREEKACIRCGRCIDACPMGLEPYLFSLLAANGRWDDTRDHAVMDCVECGSCAYVCPSARRLVDYIRLAKLHLRKKK